VLNVVKNGVVIQSSLLVDAGDAKLCIGLSIVRMNNNLRKGWF
jgi:hypothetical protein